MSLTCKWAEEAFCHIVTVVFQKNLDSPFVKVLEQEGYTHVISMLTLHDEDFSEIPLPNSDKHLLFIFRFFHLHQLLNGYSAHDLMYVTQGEFEDFRKSQHCPVIPSLIMDTLPVPASDTLAVKSAQLLPSCSVRSKAIPTPLVPVLLNTDSATNMTMVDDLTAVTLDRVTTSNPCQDNDDTSDPCIDLLGGETLPYQLHPLSADEEPKQFYPLDSMPQDVTAPLVPGLVESASLTSKASQENVDSSELPMSIAVLKSTKYQEPVISAVAQTLPSPPVAALLHVDSAHQVACFSMVPTAFDRPPAAPDPVPGVTLLKPSDSACDCTPAIPHSEIQHAHPPNKAVLLITTVSNIVRFGHSSLSPVLTYDRNPAMCYYPSSVMIPCPNNLGYKISALY